MIRAEVLIKLANPPEQGKRNDINFVAPDHEVKPQLIRDLRHAYKGITSEEEFPNDYRCVENQYHKTARPSLAMPSGFKATHVPFNTASDPSCSNDVSAHR